ncbi:MAG: type II toxin-antitoxin system VapC family toxin [Acidimicrobiales bacterium]
MKLVADTHAIVWFGEDNRRLSRTAADALSQAEAGDGILVSAASLIDLWYVTQTTKTLSESQLLDLEALLADPASKVELAAVDLEVTRAFRQIDRALLADPWDRLIVATAMARGMSLVSRDEPIRRSGLVEVIW